MINFQRNALPPTLPSSVEAKSNNKGLHWWMDGNQCAMLGLLYSHPMAEKFDSLTSEFEKVSDSANESA